MNHDEDARQADRVDGNRGRAEAEAEDAKADEGGAQSGAETRPADQAQDPIIEGVLAFATQHTCGTLNLVTHPNLIQAAAMGAVLESKCVGCGQTYKTMRRPPNRVQRYGGMPPFKSPNKVPAIHERRIVLK